MKTVSVTNEAPTLTLIGADTVDEGTTYTLTLGPVSDPGTDTVSAFRVHWGDGSVRDFSAAQVQGNGRQVAHFYSDGAAGGTSRTIEVDLLDEDGWHTSAGAKTIVVADVPPTAIIIGPDTIYEGQRYEVEVQPRDVGVDRVTAITFRWGDGKSD